MESVLVFEFCGGSLCRFVNTLYVNTLLHGKHVHVYSIANTVLFSSTIPFMNDACSYTCWRQVGQTEIEHKTIGINKTNMTVLVVNIIAKLANCLMFK